MGKETRAMASKASREGAALSLTGRWTRRAVIAVVAATVVVGAAVASGAGTPAVIKMKQPRGAEMPPVIFKHWKHQRSYKCYACHPRVFSEWEKAVFDHDAMDAGKYCGACHDGEVAFVPFDADCEVCHAE